MGDSSSSCISYDGDREVGVISEERRTFPFPSPGRSEGGDRFPMGGGRKGGMAFRARRWQQQLERGRESKGRGGTFMKRNRGRRRPLSSPPFLPSLRTSLFLRPIGEGGEGEGRGGGPPL